MKFLVLVTPGKNPPPMEDPVAVNRGALAYLKDLEARGKLECAYAWPDSRRGMGIMNVDSAEELWTLLMGYPLYPYQEYQFFPLVDLYYSFEAFIAQAEGQ